MVAGADGVALSGVVVTVPDVDDPVEVGAVVLVAPPGAGTAVAVVEVTVGVLVVAVPLALAGAMTAHATRLPASPVAMVFSSGPGFPSAL